MFGTWHHKLMYISKLNSVILIALFMLLGACTTVPDNSFPELTFKHLEPISLRVAKIQMASQTDNNTEPPNVGHRFPISPHEAVKKWALDRLQIAGNSGTARFSILKANVTETRLKTDKSFKGLFKQEASERYDAIVEARLEILDNKGIIIAAVTSRATWTQTVREDTSLTDRRRIWFGLIEKLMGTFNDRMEEEMRRYLSKLIV